MNDKPTDKKRSTTAIKTRPPLLSREGSKVATTASAPSLNWGMHHVKLVMIAENASQVANDLFQSFLRITKKALLCV